jgi:putative FmdB family regulatory protein
MPTYEYQCAKCGHTFEVRQSFADAPLTKCETCKGKVKKLFSPPAIIFKGKGFHCTDYKSKSGSPSPACADCPKADTKSGDSEAPACPAAEGKSKCAAS